MGKRRKQKRAPAWNTNRQLRRTGSLRTNVHNGHNGANYKQTTKRHNQHIQRKNEKLDKALDAIKNKDGEDKIKRASLLAEQTVDMKNKNTMKK